MLTVIGLFPGSFALNKDMTPQQIAHVAKDMPTVADLLGRYGDDQKSLGVQAAHALTASFSHIKSVEDIPARERPAMRNDLNRVLTELRTASESKAISESEKKSAKSIHDNLMKSVQYAPWWVRVLSALCLGLGTMVGYKRIVKTLGERLGRQHLSPAQGASAELVAAALITAAGLSGYPVSTTHVVTGGITGTMVGSGAGVQQATLWQIGAAWVLTLPAIVALSAGLFYLFS
jgi:PiT family inorganic phosphate transporter